MTHMVERLSADRTMRLPRRYVGNAHHLRLQHASHKRYLAATRVPSAHHMVVVGDELCASGLRVVRGMSIFFLDLSRRLGSYMWSRSFARRENVTGTVQMSRTSLRKGLEADVLYSVNLRDSEAATLFENFCDVVGVFLFFFFLKTFLSLGI